MHLLFIDCLTVGVFTDLLSTADKPIESVYERTALLALRSFCLQKMILLGFFSENLLDFLRLEFLWPRGFFFQKCPIKSQSTRSFRCYAPLSLSDWTKRSRNGARIKKEWMKKEMKGKKEKISKVFLCTDH